jgi:hypothetical protein
MNDGVFTWRDMDDAVSYGDAAEIQCESCGAEYIVKKPE